MKKMYKLGVVGCGFMAQSILKGVLGSEFLRARKIVAADPSEDTLDIVAEMGIVGTTNDRYIAENCEYVLLAVKPQHFDEVVASMKGTTPQKVISVMAGVTRDKIKAALGRGVKVARCMPNLPCAVGGGMIGVDMTDFNDSQADIEFISGVLSSMGEILSITEDKMDAVTGISGSGPAYVFMFIDSLIDAGVKQGLTKNEAAILAVQTVIGGAEMVRESDCSIPELIRRVCSKGGTTIEAVKVLEQRDFRGIVDDAVTACVKRSKELSQ